MKFALHPPRRAAGTDPVKRRDVDARLLTASAALRPASGRGFAPSACNAADYGAPQTRQRLFIQARRDHRRIVWPVRDARRSWRRSLRSTGALARSARDHRTR